MKSSSNSANKLLLIGLLFLVTGIILNEWTLAQLFSDDGTLTTSKKIVIWIFDILVISAGILFIIKKKTLELKKLKYGLYILLIMLVTVEFGLHLVSFVLHSGEKEIEGENIYTLSPYEGKEWAKDMFREYDEMTGGYKEFRGWGKNEYQGRYVNVDSNGVRKTWNPPGATNNTYQELYVFGPSAIWGYGARDDYTIPSHISKLLNKHGEKFIVYNYGEWGYAFIQELFYLIKLLRDGHRPDYVMFYAWGDFYNAYQSGKPGTLHWSFSIRSRMKDYSHWEHIRAGLGGVLNKYSMIFRELAKINRKLDPPEAEFTEAAHKYSDEELKELFDDTLDDFSKSYELLDNLSRIYGFKYICFWMPIIFTEDELTEEEKTVDIRLNDKALTKMYRYANDAYKQSSFSHFYNVSDALKGRTETYYLDFGHLSERGNEVVAKRLVSIFRKENLLNE